jgi:hypothetical protein
MRSVFSVGAAFIEVIALGAAAKITVAAMIALRSSVLRFDARFGADIEYPPLYNSICQDLCL